MLVKTYLEINRVVKNPESCRICLYNHVEVRGDGTLQ